MGRASGKQLAKHYRAVGESVHLHALEAALTDEWQYAPDLAAKAGVSRNYVNKAMWYLWEEGRARGARKRMKRPYFGTRYCYLWKRK